jgi:multiple sugar transport system permease protein
MSSIRRSAIAATERFVHQHLSWHLLFRLGVYALLFTVAYVFIFPFLYMAVTSVKSPTDLADFTVNWIPRQMYWGNYRLAFEVLNFWRYFRNSLVITSVAVIGHLMSGSFIGYGLARYRFPGSRLLFAVVVLSLILPTQTLIVPMYMLYSNLGFIGSYVPILGPPLLGFGLRGGMFIFIFRQFFLRLPYELEDAAKIDGCSFIRTFWNIVLPISQPAILVSAIIGMVWHWHDFYEPAIFVRKIELLPLTSMLPKLFELLSMTEENAELLEMLPDDVLLLYNDALAMAATVLAVLPVLLIFSLVQRYFIQGIERTGLVE